MSYLRCHYTPPRPKYSEDYVNNVERMCYFCNTILLYKCYYMRWGPTLHLMAHRSLSDNIITQCSRNTFHISLSLCHKIIPIVIKLSKIENCRTLVIELICFNHAIRRDDFAKIRNSNALCHKGETSSSD